MKLNITFYQKLFLCIFLTSLLYSLPKIIFNAESADGYAHDIIIKEFSIGLYAGEIFPRWLSNSYHGCGWPLFYFYAPLSYYLPAILHPMGIDISWFVSVLCYSMLAGYTAYRYLRCWVRRDAALWGSMIYILAPPRVFSLYVHGVMPEILGYVFIPIILLSLHKIIKDQKYRYWPLLALSLACMVMTSLSMSTVLGCTLPFFVLYYALLYIRQKKHCFYCIFLGCLAVSVAIIAAAAVLLPAIAELPNIHYATDSLIQEHQNRPLTNMLLFLKNHIFLIGTYISVFFAIFLGVRLLRAKSVEIPRIWVIFQIFMVILLSVLITPLSIGLWNVFTPIPTPARMLFIMPIILAMITGIGISQPKIHKDIKALMVICLVLVWITPTSVTQIHSRELLKNYSFTFFSHLLPFTVPTKNWQPWVDEQKTHISASKCKNRTHLLSGNASLEILQWDRKEKRIAVHAQSESVIRLGIFDYPNWKINSNTVSLHKQIDQDTGQMMVTLPRGTYEFTVHLEKTIYEKIGNILSLSFITLLFILNYRLYRRKKSNGLQRIL